MDKILVFGLLGLLLVVCVVFISYVIEEDEGSVMLDLSKEEIAEIEKSTAKVTTKLSLDKQKAELARIDNKLSEAIKEEVNGK